MAGCSDCFFGGKKVGYKGNFESPFVIVGESPGPMELAKGMPFVGPSGELLESVLNPLKPYMDGIEPFITNAINCTPRQKDPKRLAAACGRCNSRLIEELNAHPRKVILCLGNAALWSVTGNYNYKITQVRGQVFASKLCSDGIVAAVHPAFLLRGGGNLQQWQRDWRVAVHLLTGKEVPDFNTSSAARMRVSGQFRHGEIIVLDTPEKVAELAETLKGVLNVASDIETDGFNPRVGSIKNLPSCTGAGILSIGICYERGRSFVIPGNLITNELFNNSAKWCWHNGKYDISWLRHYGFDAHVDDDTMLMSYILNEKGGFHDLEQVGGDWLQAPNYKNMLDQYLPTSKHSYAHIPKDVLYKYQGIDTELTFWLRDVLRGSIAKDANLERVYKRILIPASEFLYKVERNGFYTDLQQVAANEIHIGKQCEALEKEFMQGAAECGFDDINMRSPLQLKNYLYGFLRLGPLTNSTDFDTLEMLPKHPAVKLLQEYRTVFKQLSTYVIPAREKTDPTDGRMHTTFKLHGTVTGRLSSNKPNMQNIPRDPGIRGQFSAPKGRCVLEVDLSQAELRMLACLSGDVIMIAIFLSGKSLHDEVAEYLFGKGFNKEQKMIAKNINFGIVYGISAAGLREQVEMGAHLLGSNISVTMQEAQAWIDGWYARFPQAAEFIRKCRAAPAKGQTLVSFTGRKRRFGVVGYENLNSLQNEAANFPHQSGAHDITLLAGIELIDPLHIEYDALIVNEVHDALLIDLIDDMYTIVTVARKVVSTMERIPKEWGLTNVPFKAEAGVGKRWGACIDFDIWQFTDEQLQQLKGIPHGEVIKKSK